MNRYFEKDCMFKAETERSKRRQR